MSSNIKGTVFRIGLIALTLIFLWLIFIGSVYFIVSFLLGFEFDFGVWVTIFCLVVLYRMFIPKNVFI